MRLTLEQASTIRRIVREEAGIDASVRLFGSRLDEDARGGDIDLFVQTAHPVERPALFSARMQFLGRVAAKKSRHLQSTDQRLFAERFTERRAAFCLHAERAGGDLNRAVMARQSPRSMKMSKPPHNTAVPPPPTSGETR